MYKRQALERWIEVLSEDDDALGRHMLVQETGNSKSVKLRTFRGFLVNSYEPVKAMMGDSDFIISPTAVSYTHLDVYKRQ